MLRHFVKLLAPLSMVLFLTACSTEVYSNLEEREANQMVEVLTRAGISANRDVTADGKFAISVSRSDFSRALTSLSSAGLPRKSFGSLGEVFNSDKLVSTPFEERARFMHAMNEELSKSLTEIDGVLSARVLINMPESNGINKADQMPRASVFIYQAEGVDLRPAVPTIKNLVVNSVHYLDYSAVTVALFNAAATSSASNNHGMVPAGAMGLGNLLGLLVLGFLALIGLKFAVSGGSKGKSDKKLRNSI